MVAHPNDRMPRCRRCRQRWPIRFYKVYKRIDRRIDGVRVRKVLRLQVCQACRVPRVPSPEERARAVERITAWRARLREEVLSLRAARAGMMSDLEGWMG